jgi:hypothetical protein
MQPRPLPGLETGRGGRRGTGIARLDRGFGRGGFSGTVGGRFCAGEWGWQQFGCAVDVDLTVDSIRGFLCVKAS